jgi:ribonuclease HII
MHYPNLSEEKKLWQKGFKYVAGLDEAGRGPLAGPVVAGAVSIKYDKIISLRGINDSKKLSEKKRNYFYKILTNHKDVEWGIGIVSEKIIDKINILNATKLAMAKAMANLVAKSQNIDHLLIDGNFILNLPKGEENIIQKSIIKGDQKVISISAASIIAKVTRDKIMDRYDKKYPQYGFKKHKGYPTKFHKQKIKELGLCKIHRKSFHSI